MSHTDVEFLPLVKRDVGFHGLGLVVFGGLCLLVGFLGSSELVELILDSLVLDLLEEQLWFGELMTGLKQRGAAQLSPVEVLEIDHLAQLLGTERQERLKGDGEVGNELKRDVEDGLHALRISLPHLPRLALGDVLVADAREVHSLLLCLAELEVVEVLLHLLLHVLELLDSLFVDIEQFAAGGYHPVPVFLGELQGTVDEVAIDSDKLRVVALLEVFPCEVIVLGLRCVGGKHIAQHVLLAGEVLQIFVQPHSPVA